MNDRNRSLMKGVAAVLLVVIAPSLAMAHVSVRARESKPGAEGQCTVRGPAEGIVATTQLALAVPAGVMVPEVLAAEGVGAPGERRPAAVKKLASTAAVDATQPEGSETAAIQTWMKGYDAAFNAKDLEELATFYHPDVTVYEGGGINDGWADYRDRHLGPELKAFENLQFGHRDITVSILPGGQSAYVRSEYFLKAKMGTREIDSSGLATYVLIKGADGWKIRHSHTSSRARQPAGR